MAAPPICCPSRRALIALADLHVISSICVLPPPGTLRWPLAVSVIHSTPPGASPRPASDRILMTTAPVAEHSAAEIRHAVLWILVTMLLFVAMDAVAKALTHTYPPVQIAWARFVFHAILVTLFLWRRFPAVAVTRRPGLQALRSLLLSMTTIMFFSSLQFLPLADASALMQVGPLIVTALSMPLLGEHVGPRRWASVVIGFVGALIIIRPGTDAMQPAALLTLVAASTNALYQLTTRVLRGSDATMTTLFYTPLIGAILMSIAVPFFWLTPDLEGWLLLALVGLIGAVSHFTLIKAFSMAPAATVVPFNYSTLVWATLFGLFLFGDFPDIWTIAGALIIAGSGLYILHREHARRRAAPPS